MQDPKQPVEKLVEIPSLRRATSKSYMDGGRLLNIYHCKDIHYKPYNGNEWLEREIRIINGHNKYIIPNNIFTVGFREDKKVHKYIGIRRAGNNNIQLEFTYVKMSLNGAIVQWPGQYQNIAYKDTAIEHVVNDHVSIYTEIDDTKITSSLKVDYRLVDFEIILQVHTKGLIVTNEFIEKEGIKHYIPIDGKFYFKSDDIENPLWISNPRMWNDSSTSCGIDHFLFEDNGELYYRKVPNADGTRWLSYSKPDIYIDANTYYAVTGDGYISYTNSNWTTCRSATTGSTVNTSAASYTNGATGAYISKNYAICRSFFSFSTTDITTCDWIQGAKLYICDCANGGYTTRDLSIQKGTQATTLTTADFASFSGAEYGYTSWGTTQVYHAITLGNLAIINIVRGGITKMCARETYHDFSNTATPTTTDGINGIIYSDNTGTTYDPYLLLYVVPSATIINSIAL